VVRYRVSSSDNKNDDIKLVTVVVVFQCAMVGISYAVVVGVGKSVGAMINIPQNNVESRSIETVDCILNLIFDENS
jgi:cytochrome c oxidase assembly protein Cox11